jgi:hypothetical protein
MYRYVPSPARKPKLKFWAKYLFHAADMGFLEAVFEALAHSGPHSRPSSLSQPGIMP